MYLIFLLLDKKLFSNLVTVKESWIQTILGVMIPGMLILILLLKATEFAKKGSGAIGEMVMKGAKMVGGVAGGLALGATAAVGQRTVGRYGGNFAKNVGKDLEKFGSENKWAGKLGFDKFGRMSQDIGAFAQKSSFDARGVKIAGKDLSGATGMKLGEAQKGGWAETEKQQVEKRQKRSEELQKRGTGAERKNVELAEGELRTRTLPQKKELEKADKEIEKARLDLNDVKGIGDVGETKKALQTLQEKQDAKEKIRGIKITRDENGKITKKSEPEEGSIAQAEKILKDNKHTLDVESSKIAEKYAKEISSKSNKVMKTILKAGALGALGAATGGVGFAVAGAALGYATSKYSPAAEDEAARKIRVGTKLDSGEKPK